MKLLAMAGDSRGRHNREEAKSSEIKRDQARSSEVIELIWPPCHASSTHKQTRGECMHHVVMEWSLTKGIPVKNRHAVLRARHV